MWIGMPELEIQMNLECKALNIFGEAGPTRTGQSEGREIKRTMQTGNGDDLEFSLHRVSRTLLSL